jgi:hypothetical protein
MDSAPEPADKPLQTSRWLCVNTFDTTGEGNASRQFYLGCVTAPLSSPLLRDCHVRFLFAEHQPPMSQYQSHEPEEDLKTTMKTANDTGVIFLVGLPSLSSSKLGKQLGN